MTIGYKELYDADLSWLDDYENIHTLARFLADEKSYSMDNILYFLEKPYKYTDEYNEMIKWRETCEELN